MTAGTGAGAGAGELAFVPGECTIESLDWHAFCDDDAACPVAAAGDIVCSGWGTMPSVAFDGSSLYAVVPLAEEANGTPVLVGMRVDPHAATQVTHVFDAVERGIVRLDRGEAVMLELASAELTPHRANADFTSFTIEAALPALPTFWDAGYDDRGQLHTFSRMDLPGPLGDVLGVDGAVVVESAEQAAFAVASDGATAVASVAVGSSALDVRLWTSAVAERAVLASSTAPFAGKTPAIAVAAYVGAPEGFLVAFDLGEGVRTSGSPLDGLMHASSWTTMPSRCAGRSTAYFPDLCPTDSDTLGLGPVAQRYGVLADAIAGPWLLTYEVETEETCSWIPSGPCYESRPCDCAQTSWRAHGKSELVLERISEAGLTYRLPLGDVYAGGLVHTALADGTFYVVLWSSYADDTGFHTQLRYLGVTLGGMM